MFYHEYQSIAQLKQQEVEKKAKHAWKFFQQSETKHISWPSHAPKQPNCCPTPANA